MDLLDKNSAAPVHSDGNKVNNDSLFSQIIKKRSLVRKVILISTGSILTIGAGVGVYYLVKKHRAKLEVAASLIAAAKLNNLVVTKPEFLKIPDFLSLRITAGENVGKAITETLDFAKIVQFDKAFVDRRNLQNSTVLLNLLYDRMENLISLQTSSDFNPRAMRSIERCIYVLCKKSLSHQQVCKSIERRQLINGLALLLDKTTPKT